MIKEIKLPEIADNVTTATVLDILVSEGDNVDVDDMLAEMESDKASFELPSEYAGVVKEVKVASGDEVKVGQVMFTIDTEGGQKSEDDSTAPQEEQKEVDSSDKEKEQKQEQKEEKTPEKEEESTKIEEEPEKESHREEPQQKQQPETEGLPASDVPASPAVRRLAREIGVDIKKVKGTGPHERVMEADVKAYAKKAIQSKPAAAAIGTDYELPDFSKLGPVHREKLDTIRKITARTMAESWQSIPHVFQFDKADVTELEKFRKNYSKFVEKEGAKLTFTAILLKLTAEALKKFPKFNASLDMKNEEIVYKDFVNIGVAVDTERGLLVPVIKDADKKSITELSLELNELADKARKKKIMPDQLQGGNFAISNLGGIGGTNFTPIVYRPNVAILGVSRSQMEPVYIDGEFKPRMMLPMSLSYDHRIIDGADGARFLRWLCEAMENPLLTMFK